MAVAIGTASTLCVLVQAVILGTVVQRALLGHAHLGQLTPLLVGLVAAFAARAACSWAGELAAHRTAVSVGSTLRRQLLAGAVKLGPGWLAAERTGELTGAATRGIEALDGYFSRYLPTAVVAALAPLGVLTWVLWTDWPSFVVLAATVCVVPVFMVLLGLEARRHAEEQWRQVSGLSATFYDLLRGMPTLRAFGRAAAGRRTLESAAAGYRRSTMRTLRVAFLSSAALEVLASLGTALVALFLGLRLLDGTVHLGVALAVLVLAPEVYLPLRRAGAEFHASAEGRAAAERILGLLDEADASDGPVEARDSGARLPCPSPADVDLVLRGVTVRYPGRVSPVLDRVDLVAASGEHLAVTGESGCGKSTLLGVLLGFVEPVEGSICVGGTDLRRVDRSEWRRRATWVPQRPYLVAGTIADNLRIGRPGADLAALRWATELCGLEELVARLPHGLATLVGEGGLTLSAGERQRIAIGRAVLRDAPLVLLDEPAAHLDAPREADLSERLRPWLDKRTVVLAAHRGELVGRVDRNLAMVGGTLVDAAPLHGAPAVTEAHR